MTKADEKKPKEDPAAKASGEEMAVVEIVTERVTERFDRQVYDVKQNNSTGNQSVADTLNNIPAVTVDQDGSVALRGNQNVQIMVDGKPSAVFQGENRGNNLAALPSDNYESIEVISNPGPEFGNEGGGGPILNLISRRTRRPGGSANLNANAGSGGRYSSGLNGQYSSGLWSYDGGISVRKSVMESTNVVTRERLMPNGDVNRDTTDATNLSDAPGISLYGKADFNVGAKDKAGAGFNYNKSDRELNRHAHQIDYRTGTVPYSDYFSSGSGSGSNETYALGAFYLYAGDKPQEQFRLDLRVSSNSNLSENRNNITYLVNPFSRPVRNTLQLRDGSDKVADLTGDYDSGGPVRLGFKLAATMGQNDSRSVSTDPVTGLEVVNPSQTSRFKTNETNLAGYGSYNSRFGNWRIRSGMRVEYTKLALHQITNDAEVSRSYLSWIPSLFAQYNLGESGVVKFTYARRIRRPQSYDLNPYIVYRDETSVSSGNADLKPVKTDQIEVSREGMSWFGLNASVRAYFRRESDEITTRRYFISDTVLLTTKESYGHNNHSGLSMDLNGQISPMLRAGMDIRYGRDEQTVFTQESAEAGADVFLRNSLAGSVRLNYRYDPVTNLMFMARVQGKQQSPQGYTEPLWTANLNLNRKLSDKWSMKIDIMDFFATNKRTTIGNTAFLRDHSVSTVTGRIVSIGFNYRMGGVTGNPSARPAGMRDGVRQGPGGSFPGGGVGGYPGGAGGGAYPGGGGGG